MARDYNFEKAVGGRMIVLEVRDDGDAPSEFSEFGGSVADTKGFMKPYSNQ